MKYFLIPLICILSLSLSAQQISYKEWQELAKTQVNLQPEYGNTPKSAKQIQADKEFIESALQQDSTSRKASDHLVQLGFLYFYNGDIESAMRRFNQGWLLDPKNDNVYGGYGSIYLAFKDDVEALKQFEKGLLINPDNSNILTDKATILMHYYMSKHNPDDLNKAIEILNQSYNIDPSNQNTLFKLSSAYFYKKDCPNARKFYDECIKLGGQPVPDGYEDALNKQCGG